MLPNQGFLTSLRQLPSRFTFLCTLVICLFGVSACGGSAGTVGISTGTALYTTAPSSVTLPVSQNTYDIGGGTAPYKTSSSSPQIANSRIQGNTLTIIALTGGTAQVTVTDATGSSININVNVSVPITTTPAFFTTAPESITLANNGVASFSIVGGKPAYMISSSNTAVATVGINGSSFFVAGAGSGTAQVVLFDTTGASTSISVTVGNDTPVMKPALYVTSASAISFVPNETATYQIGGGTPPYIVSSSNTSVASASVSGSTLRVTGLVKGSAQISVFDANGASINLTATIDSPESIVIPLFVTAPSSISMAIGKQNTYSISGGKAPYTVSSSNTSVANSSAIAGAMTISSIASGSAQILIFDATGASVTISLTVEPGSSPLSLYTTAASNITMASNSTVSYAIGGGTPPYQLSTNNPTVATATLNNSSFSINSIAAGSAKISIFDSTGNSLSIDVTTTSPGVIPIDTLPSSATANVGDSLQFSVHGGTPPYNVTVNNVSIATVSTPTVLTSGGSIFASLLNAGNTSINVVDAAGQTKSISLTVNQQSTQLRLSPSTLTIGEDNLDDITLYIFGGTGTYRAFTSDQTLTSVSTSENRLTIGLGSNTYRCINPIDTSGVRIPNGTFSITITVIDSLGASASAVVNIIDNGIGTGSLPNQTIPFMPPCL